MFSESGGQEPALNTFLIFRQMVHEASTSLKEKLKALPRRAGLSSLLYYRRWVRCEKGSYRERMSEVLGIGWRPLLPRVKILQ